MAFVSLCFAIFRLMGAFISYSSTFFACSDIFARYSLCVLQKLRDERLQKYLFCCLRMKKTSFCANFNFQSSFTGNINSMLEETSLRLSSIKPIFVVQCFNFMLIPKTKKSLLLLTLFLYLVSPLQSSVGGQGFPQRR